MIKITRRRTEGEETWGLSKREDRGKQRERVERGSLGEGGGELILSFTLVAFNGRLLMGKKAICVLA